MLNKVLNSQKLCGPLSVVVLALEAVNREVVIVDVGQILTLLFTPLPCLAQCETNGHIETNIILMSQVLGLAVFQSFTVLKRATTAAWQYLV